MWCTNSARGAQRGVWGSQWWHSMEGDGDNTRILTQGHSAARTVLTQPHLFFCRQNLPVPHAGLHRDLPQHAGPHDPHESALQTQPLLQVSPGPPHLSLSPICPYPLLIPLPTPCLFMDPSHVHTAPSHASFEATQYPTVTGQTPGRVGGSVWPKVTTGGLTAPDLTLPVAPQM